MTFGLDDTQQRTLDSWLMDPSFKEQETGAIGGALTFEFTPTSIGEIVKVTWCKGMPQERTIDLTDYGAW